MSGWVIFPLSQTPLVGHFWISIINQDTKKEIFGLLLKMGLQSEDSQSVYLQTEGFGESEIKSILHLKIH
jgi:hypothetical protein